MTCPDRPETKDSNPIGRKSATPTLVLLHMLTTFHCSVGWRRTYRKDVIIFRLVYPRIRADV